MDDAQAPRTGWLPSPSRPGQLQYFDGTAWQDAYAPAERQGAPERPLGRPVQHASVEDSSARITRKMVVVYLLVLVVAVAALAVAGVESKTIELVVFGYFAVGSIGFAGSMRARRLDSLRGPFRRGPFGGPLSGPRRFR